MTGATLANFNSRLDWAGEVPAAGAVLLQRFEALDGTGATKTLPDVADPAKTWTLRNAAAATAGLSAGRWGNNLSLNRTAPATEQTSLTVPNFAGLWPASGKMLFKVWASLSFAMGFTPIISSRNTTGVAPLVYLSTTADGRPRAMIYNAAGTAILDQSETAAAMGWTPVANEWVCYLWLVDLDAKTSQVGLVRRANGQSFVGPVRTWTGTANAACTAAFEVATLSPTAAYWAGGYIDEVGYWQPATASMSDLVSGVVRSLPARGRDNVDGVGLTVTDTVVTASAAATLLTGSRPATWTFRPIITVDPLPLSAVPSALLSTDGGATWSAGTLPDALPMTFNGLVRWSAPLGSGEQLTALRVVEDFPPPELDPATVNAGQNTTVPVALSGAWTGTPVFEKVSGSLNVTFTGTTMNVQAGWAIGTFTLLVTVTDDSGKTSEPAAFTVNITPGEWVPPGNPVYARAPLIVYDAGGQRAHLIADPIEATLSSELNGEHTLTFVLPRKHPRRAAIATERTVEVVGEQFRVRRIKDYRDGGVPVTEVYCEARFYDLGTAGQVDTTNFGGSQAGTELALVVAGAGWTVGTVNVSTVRTWSMQSGSPLACLRQIADVHGGDLVFDNVNRKVSLLTFAGKDRGVTFLYGRGTADAKRVEDTTTLATRITPRNAEGVGIASVNGGVPYLEDFTHTTEVREAVYDFKSGTNPYTMLALTQAALGKRAKPSYSYEVDVIDLSAWSGQDLDRFDVGDIVLVDDSELGIRVTNRILRLEYDLVRPWATKIVLSGKLRELGSDNGTDAATLTTGADIDTRDIVPFNLLRNARFDNGLAHWAASGATVVDGGVTGAKHVEMAGGGVRWVEQTFAPDTRDAYTISFQLGTTGFAEGVIPAVDVIAEITYEDATTETITQQVT